jgi:hypothetical protein
MDNTVRLAFWSGVLISSGMAIVLSGYFLIGLLIALIGGLLLPDV